MIDEDIWPICDSINMAASEDAKKLAEVLNELFLDNQRIRGELEGQWEHIRNLELLLLNPIEVPVTKKEWKLDI